MSPANCRGQLQKRQIGKQGSILAMQYVSLHDFGTITTVSSYQISEPKDKSLLKTPECPFPIGLASMLVVFLFACFHPHRLLILSRSPCFDATCKSVVLLGSAAMPLAGEVTTQYRFVCRDLTVYIADIGKKIKVSRTDMEQVCNENQPSSLMLRSTKAFDSVLLRKSGHVNEVQ